MKLTGRYLSPFVRRTATSMALLDVPYDLNPLSTATETEAIRAINPLGRVPVLELDDGTVLIDSACILDWLDHYVGAEKALVPFQGSARRDVLNLVAFGLGACEKVVAAYYERSRRPDGLMWEDWATHCEQQARNALEVLDRHQAERGTRPLSGNTLTQADVTAVIAYDFARIVLPSQVAPDGSLPHLAGASRRANALPAFQKTQWIA